MVAIKVRQDANVTRVNTSEIRPDTKTILEKIDQLQARLPQQGIQDRDDYMLQRYLEEMTTYTERVPSSVQNEEGEMRDSEGLPVHSEDLANSVGLDGDLNMEATGAELAALEEYLVIPGAAGHAEQTEILPSAARPTPPSSSHITAKEHAAEERTVVQGSSLNTSRLRGGKRSLFFRNLILEISVMPWDCHGTKSVMV